ncbi:MAG: OmpA family protein [Bacteroidetes bacterium]|nr:OmpA family protein [Bacteroidota bacterium]
MRPLSPTLLPMCIGIAAGAALLTSCANYHVRKGDEAYGLMAYAKAERHYTKALDHVQDRGVLVRAAEAARKQNHAEQAAAHYQAADAIAPLSGEEAFHYGQVLMSLGRWEQAEGRFLAVLNERPEDGAALDLLGSCQGYRSFYRDSTQFTISELPLPGIRTAFSAVPYRNGLLITGEQSASLQKANPWNGLSFLDLYYVEKHTLANWSPAEKIKGDVNGPYHEGPAVLSKDGRTLYFTRSNYYTRKLHKDAANVSHLKLFRAQLDEKGEWGEIREFGFNSESYSVGHPALSKDGRTLYFVSDMPGGLGGTDIWKCVDNGTGWNTPENLGPTVNTSGNEMFPTVNGDVLYFSSTAHENMGGLDIFEAHDEGGQWSSPQNLGYPINTTSDDFGFLLDSTGTGGYLSSNRSGPDRVYTLFVNEPVLLVSGTVMGDEDDALLANAEVTLTELPSLSDTTMMTGDDGAFTFKLKRNARYTLKAGHPGRLTQTRPVSTQGLSTSTTLRADMKLPSLVLDKAIAVRNIYYDYDEWNIRPDAAVELDKLAQVFMDNPQMSFELSSHTDSRGGDTYNLVLSDARARSAVDYLIRKGVDPHRLTARGYGESQLVNRCTNGAKCTEEEHQANRRTEFKVTSVKELASEQEEH